MRGRFSRVLLSYSYLILEAFRKGIKYIHAFVKGAPRDVAATLRPCEIFALSEIY